MRRILNGIIILLFILNSLVVNAKDSGSHLGAKLITTNEIAKALVLPSATIAGTTTVCQNATGILIPFTGVKICFFVFEAQVLTFYSYK